MHVIHPSPAVAQSSTPHADVQVIHAPMASNGEASTTTPATTAPAVRPSGDPSHTDPLSKPGPSIPQSQTAQAASQTTLIRPPARVAARVAPSATTTAPTSQQPQPRARTRSPASLASVSDPSGSSLMAARSMAVPGPGVPVPNTNRQGPVVGRHHLAVAGVRPPGMPLQGQQHASISPSSSSSSSVSSAAANASSTATNTQRSTTTTAASSLSPAIRPPIDQKPRIPSLTPTTSRTPASTAPNQALVSAPPKTLIPNPTRTLAPSQLGSSGMGEYGPMDASQVAASPPLTSVVAFGTHQDGTLSGSTGTTGVVAGTGQAKVPAFLNKLFSMINDVSTDPLIYWSEDGKSFFIPNAQQFGAILLPQFFKHRNFTSFVRQLNMYGFKKVPHLQSGVLSSFPQPTNELWEFNNPKFMRGHPELLASITRKKSAKEMAASQAAAAASHGARGHGKGDGEDEHEEEDVNMDGQDSGVTAHYANGAVGTASGPALPKSGATSGDTSIVDPSAVNKALTVMHAHTSHLEKQLAELKASNELLWRQAMVSREEQIKSQKKLDGVMRFLANQFGGMAMALAGDGSEEGMDSQSLEATGSGRQKPVRRLGKSRMIGDGTGRISENTSDDDAMVGQEDGHLWADLDGSDKRDLWELGDDGEMVKVKHNQRPMSRPGHPRSTSTPNRRSFDRLTSSRNPGELSPSKRFVSLEASPEEMPNQSFDNTANLDASRTQAGQPIDDQGQITSNALTTYHAGHLQNVNVQSFSMDPALLSLPLGTLLQTPAGAQLLANLSQAAADWVNQNAMAGKSTADAFAAAAAASPRPLSPRLTSAIASVATPVGTDRFQPVPSPSEQSAPAGVAEPSPAGSDMLWINDINDLFENASAADPATQTQSVSDPSQMPLPAVVAEIAPPPSAFGQPTVDMPETQINWADPQVEALLHDLVGEQNTTSGNAEGSQPFIDTAFVEPSGNAPYDNPLSGGGIDFEDPVFEFDFDNTFGNPMQASAVSMPNSSTEDSANTTPKLDQETDPSDGLGLAGFEQPLTGASDMFAGPTRKKRKTDQREP